MNGKVYMRVGEELVKQEIPAFPKDTYERIAGMIDLRNELRHVLDIQSEGCTDEALNRAQWKLNADYNRFVRKYGIRRRKRIYSQNGRSARIPCRRTRAIRWKPCKSAATNAAEWI